MESARNIVHQLTNFLAVAIAHAESLLLPKEGPDDPADRHERLDAIRQSVLDARTAVYLLYDVVRQSQPAPEPAWQAALSHALAGLAPGEALGFEIERQADGLVLRLPGERRLTAAGPAAAAEPVAARA